MSTTTNYFINLYRSLIIKRDELKNQTEENKKNYYQMYKELYKEYYGLKIVNTGIFVNNIINKILRIEAFSSYFF